MSINQEDIIQQLAGMRKELDAASGRFVDIEKRLEILAKQLELIVPRHSRHKPIGNFSTPASYEPPKIDAAHAKDESQHDQDSKPAEETAPEESTAQSQPPPEADSASQGLESQIGSLWLNRLGVAALLVGFVSLLLYSFQYFGPVLRVSIGAVIASLIIYFSHRRNSAAAEHKFFFEGLNALGWSSAFFLSYGMYFVEALKILPNILFELPILLATAAGGMADAVAFESEATAILSNSFAFASLVLCAGSVDPALFNLAFPVIAAALTFVSIRQKWHGALFVCCCLFFWSMCQCNLISGPILPGLTHAPNIFMNLSLIAGWLIFNSAIWVLKKIPVQRRWAVLGTSLVSAYCLPQMLNYAISLQAPAWDSASVHAWVYGSIGMVYLLTARFFKRLESDDLWSLHYLIGLSLVNACRWVKLSGFSEQGLIADICEIALLTVFGLRFKIPMFRYFAAAWSLLAASFFSSNMPLLLCGIIVFTLCSHLHTRPDFIETQSKLERQAFAPWYYVLANIFGLNMIFHCFQPEWQCTALTIQASINVVLSLKLRWKTITGTAALLLFCFAADGLFLEQQQTLQTVLSAALSYAVYFYCRDLCSKTPDTLAKFWRVSFAIFSNLIIFWSVCTQAPANCISAGWGLHGLILIALGFVLLERTFRIFALCIFAVLTLRLLFFDLASAPTLERIISFIVAGGVFVSCSYVYTWFSKSILGAAKDTNKLAPSV